MFEWHKPPSVPAARPPAPRRACWRMGCDQEAVAVVGRTVPGLPLEAELCVTCELVLEFELENAAITAMPHPAPAWARGSEADGWIVSDMFLLRPTAAH